MTEGFEFCNTMTDDEYRDEVRRMYPDMPEDEIERHLSKTVRDANGLVVRGEDMFDFSGYLKGPQGTSGTCGCECGCSRKRKGRRPEPFWWRLRPKH